MTIKEFEIQLALGSLTYGMKLKLARNKRTSKEILTTLSTDKNMYVRWNVADNPNTPEEVLTILSTDEDNSVRYNVANNSNTPTEVLTILSTDEDWYVNKRAVLQLQQRVDFVEQLDVGIIQDN